MKKILCLIVALLLCLSVGMAMADKHHDVDLQTTGYGSISAEPDLMRISATVSSMDKELSVARESVSKSVSAIHEALKALCISEEDIVTSGYICTTLYDYTETPYVLTGYQTTHTLSVTCHDPALIDAVLEALVGNGMTEIYGIEFDVSNRKELYLKALALAVDAAREKAAVLTKAAGLDEYLITDIREESNYGFSNYLVKETASDSRAISTGIRTGDVTIDASVTVEFTAR